MGKPYTLGWERVAHHGANSPKTALLGPISTTRRAWLVLHGSAWVHTYSHCHQMITYTFHLTPRQRVPACSLGDHKTWSDDHSTVTL